MRGLLTNRSFIWSLMLFCAICTIEGGEKERAFLLRLVYNMISCLIFGGEAAY